MTAVSRPAGGLQAETQVIRVITVVLGISTVVFLGLTWTSMTDESASLNPIWQTVSVIGVFALPPVFAAFAFRWSRTALTRALGSYAVLFALVTVTFVPAMTSGPLAANLAPWPVLITALGTVPAALAWRPVWAWLFLLGNSIVIAPVRFLASGGVDWAAPLQYAFFTITFAGIFSALTMVAMSNGRSLDAAAAVAHSTAARAAAATAREQEQARLDALVHDEVISTLFYASQDTPELTESVQRQARQTIDHLARLREPGEGEPRPIDMEDFVSRIRAVALELSGNITFGVHGWCTQPVPAEVASAFVEATAEAVRNSLQHAGSHVRRSATVTLNEDGIAVTILDDGIGFDLRSVAPHRLGIEVSIRGRLGAIRGGSATVNSQPGAGTRILLEWRPR